MTAQKRTQGHHTTSDRLAAMSSALQMLREQTRRQLMVRVAKSGSSQPCDIVTSGGEIS